MSTQPSSDSTLAPLLRSPSTSTLGPASSQSSIFDASPDPKRRRQAQFRRILSFISAILGSLCAGSTLAFSLYAPRFQSRLYFTQFEINAIASAMTISMYVMVPVIGYMCDRVGPGPMALTSVPMFAGGYGLAAYLYQKGDVLSNAGARGDHSIVPYMVIAFVLVGAGTSAMHLASITTCAKNFGKGKYRGLMLVAPIAAFGLSGMLMSQIGSHFLYERRPDGSKGEVDIVHFFLFLVVLLSVVGLLGGFALRIIGEDELIEEAVEELERSGVLDGSAVFRGTRPRRGYGAINNGNADFVDNGILDSSSDHQVEQSASLKKKWLLNAETHRFLTDHTMWWFAIGFLLIIGPGEAFINNFGTIIGTLYSPGPGGDVTSTTTHVSIVACSSTAGRLLVGSVSDFLSPSPHSPHPQTGVDSSLPTLRKKLSVSRVSLLLLSALVLSFGTLFLASGSVQGHGERFWVVSASIGGGYGALFSITSIMVTIIWGVENFGTNYGIITIFPAIGSTAWGMIYSAVYQAGAKSSPSLTDGSDDDVFCYGKQCYSSTFWAMTACIWAGCLLVLWAWKGRDGWAKRGILI